MPPLPRLRVAALRDLADQLRYAPREALLRDLDRVEALAVTINPDELYHEGWVIERVTGYRPELEEPARLVGEAVLGDLSALVERLSSLAKLNEDELKGPCATTDQLCDRWAVSRKSLDRYRKRGLIARRVVDGQGRDRLVFTSNVITRFEDANEGLIRSAKRYTRIAQITLEAILIRARDMHDQGDSLNVAAQNISCQIGRSHEAVRQILRKHDERAEDPIFSERGPVSKRERELAIRAWLRGFGVARISAHLHRSTPSVRRAINVRRAELLKTIKLSFKPPRTSDPLPEDGLALAWPDDPPCEQLPAFLALSRSIGAPLGIEEQARAKARRVLLARAHKTIAGIRASVPSVGVIDDAETDLRWALRLKQALIRAQLPTIIRTIENRLERPLEQVGAASLRVLLEGALIASGEALDEFNPSKGGRLAARVSLSVDRFTSEWVRRHRHTLSAPHSPSRALPRLASHAPMTDWRWILAWNLRWIDLPPRARANLEHLDPRTSAFLMRRFGLGSKPSTLNDLIEPFELTKITAPQFERVAIFDALRPAD